MMTFLEFRCRKALAEAHQATPQELLQLGIKQGDPSFIEKLAQLWVKAGKDPHVAQYMASKGLIPDEKDAESTIAKGGNVMAGTNKYQPKPLSLSAQQDVERRWDH